MAGNSVKHLFEIYDHKSASHWATAGFKSNNAAPELMPINPSTPTNFIPQLINVWNDFEWTHTPQEGRKEIPYIRLSEQRVEFNSLVQHLRFMLTTAKEGLQGAAEHMGDAGKAVSDIIQKGATAAEKFATGGKGIQMMSDFKDLPTYLQPFHGLYGTSPTGFEYAFPYFEGDWKSISTA